MKNNYDNFEIVLLRAKEKKTKQAKMTTEMKWMNRNWIRKQKTKSKIELDTENENKCDFNSNDNLQVPDDNIDGKESIAA